MCGRIELIIKAISKTGLFQIFPGDLCWFLCRHLEENVIRMNRFVRSYVGPSVTKT